jgi:hypothetical protein
VSIRRLLVNPDAAWTLPAVTTHGFQNHAVRSERWRYIRYANGDEELYDHSRDPFEFTNMARSGGEFIAVKEQLAQWLPKVNNPAMRANAARAVDGAADRPATRRQRQQRQQTEPPPGPPEEGK